MLEIICKILFFLSMLAVYTYVTSTSKVILIVVGYIACVFSYYYFNVIQSAFDKFLNYVNFNSKFSNNITPPQVSGYFVSKKYSKISNSMPSKKLFSYCTPEPTFTKEPILDNNELPSPILKSNSPARNRPSRDKLKLNVPDPPVLRYRNGFHNYNPLSSKRTFMNVNSPGFTSRVVDKAVESASYHIKYPAVRQISTYRFDKSTLRHLSKMPRANSTPVVRIAPPEPTGMNLLSDNGHGDRCNDEVKNNNFLQVLKDISRKRNYIQEEADRSGSNPKKSRKNDVKNFMTSQYKRSHEDSNDSLEDKSKKRCDDYDRDVAKMMVYTSSMSVIAPDFVWNNHSKKRKSSKIEKSTTESPEQNEKYRKIGKEELKTDLKRKPTPKEQTKNSITIEAEVNSQLKEVKEVDFPIKEKNRFDDIPPPSEDGEYIRVAGGKLLNRTNCTYRKKLNSSKIDPVSVIATEPELVNGTSEADDDLMKENLLKNLIDDIERNGDRDEDVIFYQNSIVEEIAKNENRKKAGTPSVTSSPVLPTVKVEEVDAISSVSPAKNMVTIGSDDSKSNENGVVDFAANSDEISEVISNRKNIQPIIESKEIIHSEPPPSISFNMPTSTFAFGIDTNSNPLMVSSSSQDVVEHTPNPIPATTSASTLTFGSSAFQFNSTQPNEKSVFTSSSNELPKTNNVFSNNQTNCFNKVEKSESSSMNQISLFGHTPMSSASGTVFTPADTFTNPVPTSTPNFQFEQTPANTATNFSFGTSNDGFKFNAATTAPPTFGNKPFESTASSFNVSSPTFNAATPSFSSSQSAFGSNLKFGSENPTFSSTVPPFNPSTTASSFSANVPSFSAPSSNFEMSNGLGSATQSQNSFGQSSLFAGNQPSSFGTENTSVCGQTQFGAGGTQNHSFNFGTNSTPSFNSNAAPASFGGGNNNALPSFNNNSTFNFGNGSSSFGGNTFGAMAPKAADNSFSFGAGGATPAQNAFQIGTAASSGQPFAFGAGSGGAPAVGFSIGAGGSTRNKCNRNRRNK